MTTIICKTREEFNTQLREKFLPNNPLVEILDMKSVFTEWTFFCIGDLKVELHEQKNT